MLTDPFCKLSHRQNTNPASSHHIAPLHAARVCPEETRNLRCFFRHFTKQHGSICISQELSAWRCSITFSDFHPHKMSTFNHTKHECNEASYSFSRLSSHKLLRHQSDICAAQQRFLPVRFFLLPLLTLGGEFVFLHTRTIRPPYGISRPKISTFLKNSVSADFALRLCLKFQLHTIR
jgi:hypothetical protein